ncbi:MAG: acyltransferase [Bacteroidetes bacterium]|nr:acyltransferase [Bacteroidota bacterium]HET6244973.1 acyltransferase [Bacteroidia bacterium]
MVYGFFNTKEKKFFNKTRISSSVKLINKGNISINNNVWIGHFCLLDGIGGINIGQGVHIASHSCIYTHSSENSIRLLGEKYIEVPANDRPGYISGPVEIGAYTFIGTSCVILAGTTIGKGCIIGAGSIVRGNFPDYSVIVGNPGKIVGDTKNIDKKLLLEGVSFENYYDKSFIPASQAIGH